MMPPKAPQGPQPTPLERLEKLARDAEAAETAVREGRRVDMRAMDADSQLLHKLLKGKQDPALQPALMQAISALERLTSTLETQLETLKAKKP